MDNDYYVYEHIRDDTGKCFYVGKGHGKRAYVSGRNEHHDRVASKTSFTVKIIRDGLSEDEAYQLERDIIHDYVFNKGYGIDIIGYNNNKDENGHLTNHSFGGDGSYGMVHSDEWKKQHSLDMTGTKNPMYGVNNWEHFSKEKADEIKKKCSSASSGKNNPMYGVSPSERMSDEKYAEWKKKTVERLKNQTRSNNPNAKGISVYSSGHELLCSFNTILDCIDWLREHIDIAATDSGIRDSIRKCCKQDRPYKGYYYFKYHK